MENTLTEGQTGNQTSRAEPSEKVPNKCHHLCGQKTTTTKSQVSPYLTMELLFHAKMSKLYASLGTLNAENFRGHNISWVKFSQG